MKIENNKNAAEAQVQFSLSFVETSFDRIFLPILSSFLALNYV